MTGELPPLRLRWRNLWRRLGALADDDAIDGALTPLLSAWGEPGRFYHTRDHLDDVLRKLDWGKHGLRRTEELSALTETEWRRMFDTVELALWYHDAVYDPREKDNEAKSRDWLLEDARRLELPDDAAIEAARLVDLTAQHGESPTLAGRVMTDCDLAILGAPPEIFARYDEDIRKEYAHVPLPVYRAARKKVLKGFLVRLPVFRTRAFRAEYEEQARGNLARATMPFWRRLFHK